MTMRSLPSRTTLTYEVTGSGPLIVLVMGAGSPGRVWHPHQVPALVDAGFRVATFDNRGVGSASGETGFVVADLVADTAALIEHLGGGPACAVGTSLGARIVQELALARPDLVRKAVALAAHARLDAGAAAMSRGEISLFDANVALPPGYRAAVAALQYLSPATLRGPSAQDWLDVFEISAPPLTAGYRDQLVANLDLGDRRAAYRAVTVPMLVVAYADDASIPPHLSQEVADAIPGARYAEIPNTGHLGYLERPDAVNQVVIDFLKD
jgi:pimeloyl-ACP methyl ester carboxylesterase